MNLAGSSTHPTADGFRARFAAAWARSDRLFACLRPQALLARPIALRHPFVFYLGHLPAFAWNQIGRGALGYPAIHAEFDRLFERGIDPADERAAARASRSAWPEISRVLAYRDEVRDRVRRAVDEVLDRGRTSDDPLLARGRVLRLVLEHEWMHHETLLYMVQALDHGAKTPPEGLVLEGGPRGSDAREVRVPAGRAVLGTDLDRADFAWDNELARTEVDVPSFAMDALPVTNEEFARFVDAGGYERAELWSPEGFAWRREVGLLRPWTWVEGPAGLAVRTPFSDVPFEVARAWPVATSWAEADAYARWRGRRLPTEAEWRRAAHGVPAGPPRERPWGDAALDPARANADFARWSPEPVGRRPAGASAWGLQELVGQGWEWTSSVFAPLPGFTPWARTYPGYSADFFDGRHRVLLGASWATDAGLVRASFRNWFQPHYPYVFAKFRTVAAP